MVSAPTPDVNAPRDLNPMRERIVSQARAVRLRLVKWYKSAGRDLPWRHTRDPYAILVSEVMLQQTQVATVIPYFARFLSRFPTAEALASAPESDVMALWSGLGYYRRARMLQGAAQALVREHGGKFPREMAAIRALPGIGQYTAGAVASFAYDAAEAVVDANVARVLARVFCYDKPPDDSAGRARIWEWARGLLPPGGARVHNNALMELGALVCRPEVPRCADCPLGNVCLARSFGKVSEIPVPKKKQERLVVSAAGILLEYRGKYLVRPVPKGNWHDGMWEFPQERVPDGIAPREVAASLAREALKHGEQLRLFAELAYTVTRHRVTLSVFKGAGNPGRIPDGVVGGQWLTLEKIGALPLGSPQKRIVNLLRRDSELPFES